MKLPRAMPGLVPALLTLTLAGCAQPGADTTGRGQGPDSLLPGTVWQLVHLPGAADMQGTKASLAFERDGRVTGSAPCNRYHGTFEVSGPSLRIGPLASTRILCEQPLMRQETAYLGALQDARLFTVTGSTLLIHSVKLDRPLRFERQQP